MDSQEPKKRTRTQTRKVKLQPEKKVELVVEEPVKNKYAPKPKVGANRPKNIVQSVGLNKLKVETVNGYTDV